MHTIKKITVLLLFSCGVFSVNSCGNANVRQRADSLFLMIEDQEIYYSIKTPDEKHFLPYVLEEISGLGWKEENVLFAVDDETGKVFEYNLDVTGRDGGEATAPAVASSFLGPGPEMYDGDTPGLRA